LRPEALLRPEMPKNPTNSRVIAGRKPKNFASGLRPVASEKRAFASEIQNRQETK
jgi:hypothetical protein